MFRRTQRPDGDIVAAAQRRLALLAHHHSGASSAGAPASAPDGMSAADGVDAAAEDTAGPTHAPLPTPARHLGTSRPQLGRWDVGAPHLTVAALGVLVLVIAVAWWSLRSVPHTESVQLSSHGVSTAPPAVVTPAPVLPASTPPTPPSVPGSSAPSTAASGRLVVDVAGKVRRPGIVDLAAGSRVVDAIAAAGGANPGVSLTSLNLARLLVDGEQIVVGIDVPSVAAATSGASGDAGTAPPTIAPVNLNTATAEQLDTLPGVGPVTAQAILAFRSDNGPFVGVDQLLEVSGIGDATLADLRPYVYV